MKIVIKKKKKIMPILRRNVIMHLCRPIVYFCVLAIHYDIFIKFLIDNVHPYQRTVRCITFQLAADKPQADVWRSKERYHRSACKSPHRWHHRSRQVSFTLAAHHYQHHLHHHRPISDTRPTIIKEEMVPVSDIWYRWVCWLHWSLGIGSMAIDLLVMFELY